jgi:hypothetical protein
MKITKRKLRKIIREEAAATKKYDDDSALKGDQDELPDGLQKGIIDKTVDEREKEEKKDESYSMTLTQLRRIVREAVAEQLDAEHPSDVEPEEDVWSGFDNLHKDVDHAEVHHGADPVVDAPEMMNIVGETRSGCGAHIAHQKTSPMRSRASKELTERLQRR